MKKIAILILSSVILYGCAGPYQYTYKAKPINWANSSQANNKVLDCPLADKNKYSKFKK